MLLSVNVTDVIGIVLIIVLIILFIKSLKAWVLSRIVASVAIIVNLICLIVNNDLSTIFLYVGYLYTFGFIIFEVSTETREFDEDDFIPSDIENPRLGFRDDKFTITGEVKSYGIVTFIVVCIILSILYFACPMWVKYLIPSLMLLFNAICLLVYFKG